MNWPTVVDSNESQRLEVVDLIASRGDRPLFGALNFSLERGEVARIRGPNGSGKTTLLRTIAGLYRPFSGAVNWYRGDAPITESRGYLDRLCFIGHDNALNSTLTPFENLAALMRIGGEPSAVSNIRHQLVELGLKRVMHKPCAKLSAGQRRRVSLARLWLSNASLWLLDEPASALDADSRSLLSEHIAAHARQGGLALFTTHESLTLPGIRTKPIELGAW